MFCVLICGTIQNTATRGNWYTHTIKQLHKPVKISLCSSYLLYRHICDISVTIAGILVGVFLGALLVVLVILLIVLLLKRRSDHHGLTNSSSVTSQTAFLGGKNNLQQAGQVHCINNQLYTGTATTPKPAMEGGAVVKDTEAVKTLTNECTGEPPDKSNKAQELELGLKDNKQLPNKAPYIDTNDIGEELLYC